MSERARALLSDFTALWCRLYMLFLVLILLVGVVMIAWLVWSAFGLQQIILSTLALIPLSLGGSLVISLPVALIWMLAARLMGWPVVPTGIPLPDKPVCDRCSYDISGIHQTRCPECGRELAVETTVV